MTGNPIQPPSDINSLQYLPKWVSTAKARSLEDLACMSGAALSQLSHLGLDPDMPHALWRERQALAAACATVAFSGRSEGIAALRDNRHLLRDGDAPGPAGEIYASWLRVVQHPMSLRAIGPGLPTHSPEELAEWLDAGVSQGQTAPVAQCATVLETVLRADPRAETTALILADVALAQSLRWKYMLPLLATGLRRRALTETGDALRASCHIALVTACRDAIASVFSLARGAERLRAVRPKLRAKAADAALNVFLNEDSAMPAALPMPDRAARRLCERLVNLGALRELTGRDTFRLYGI